MKIVPFDMEHHGSAWSLWEKTLPHSHDTSWNYAMTERFISHNHGLSFCAFQNNRLIGTVMGSYDGRRGYIQHLAVEEGFRKKGVGRELMSRALSAMEKMDIRKIHLLVKKENISVRSFYEKTGWDGRDDIIIMSTRLKDEDPE